MIQDVLARIALMVPAYLIAIVFHEYAHALAATWFGDDTPERAGRLTINPLSHIDPIGLVCLLFLGIGWARPVPFDPRNFKYPRLQGMLVGLSGPCANFVMALLLMYGARYFPVALVTPSLAQAVTEIMGVAIWVNLMLGVFNLLPLPPLDGSHVIYALIPKSWRYAYFMVAQYSMFILIFLIYFGGLGQLILKGVVYMRSLLSLLVI